MILILDLEVRTLKNITTLTIAITTRIVLTKRIATIKVAQIINVLAPRRHQP